jgi:hypothetical protein
VCGVRRNPGEEKNEQKERKKTRIHRLEFSVSNYLLFCFYR